MSRSEAPVTTNPYTLSSAAGGPSAAPWLSLKRVAPLLAGEKQRVIVAFVSTIVASLAGLVAPVIIARAVDVHVRAGDFGGVLRSAGLLLGAYVAGLVATYVQTLQMGKVGRYVLFNLRNALFTRLQELPVDFFNQNKAGDLISRINNDTDKLNVFFAQSLVQLAANSFMMAGAAIFLIALDVRLGLATLAPAAGVLALTKFTGGWVKRRNAASLAALGALSGEIQESTSNFRVIVAFDRVDYFRQQFAGANARNYDAAVRAGVASNIYIPVYGLAHNLAQLVVLAFGFWLITESDLTVGLLIGFLLYVNSFYLPLRQLAAVWSSFQLAMASLDRIYAVLALQSNLPRVADTSAAPAASPVLAFEDVSFTYPGGRRVLHGATFALAAGKTYALVGPTGGGKTTTASLMARLYDPTAGRVLLNGRDLRSYSPEERAARIGFILQEPFLFSGTVRDNIVYGHASLQRASADELMSRLEQKGLVSLLTRFEQGLDTAVKTTGDGISLGQKQLIAFIRAVLREPEILILDEATANIDTVTEQLLEQILRELPATTTRVVIAHRLNTIENADEIFFINGEDITPAGSMDHALELLMHGRRAS
jgi:ATP-binding cassette subfamily B protein